MTLPRRAQAPDPTDRERAFSALFRTHYPGMCRFLVHILGSQSQAEDVAQDVFMYVWTRVDVIDESFPSRAYLYRAAHNSALNRIRHVRIERRWAEGQPAPEPASPTIAEEVAHDQLVEVVERAIRDLPERCRLVYTMSRQEELTYQEIAAVLGLSVKTVEAHMARAFRHLRAAVAPHLL
jgi:RNA polymerase sigma-70 factor (ECF subfamily)